MIKVTLDPGHGKNANRGIDTSYYEGNRMYEYAQLLAAQLRAYGIYVEITRQAITDDPSFTSRGKLAGSNGSQLFYSIHSNAAASADAHGVSVFYSVDLPGDADIAKDWGDKVAALMGTYMRGAQYRESTKYPGEDYYTVIDAAQDAGVPHVILVEHGFHTNAGECAWLLSDANLERLAALEADIICDIVGVPGQPTAPADTLRDTVLRTVAAEARGEPYEGQMAVAQCIRDRANDAKQRFGKGLEGVLRPGQFAAPWPGDLSTVPSVQQAVEAVFDRGESAYPQAVLWFLGKNAKPETTTARDAKYVRLGTIAGQTFWGDELAAQPVKPKNPYAVPAITKDHMLRKGSEGDAVKWLQWILAQGGYNLGKWGIDGDFGGQTEKAVEAYQRDRGLEDDGVVGPKTFAKLQNI